MEAGETSYRLYSCARCAKQVRVCRHCDRGNRYCGGECASIRRRESLARAGQRYQTSYRGACRHAARQSRWRERRAQIVTHQGSLAVGVAATVAAVAFQARGELCHDDPPGVRPCLRVAIERCCSFCGGVLSFFARLGPLRGGP